MAQLKARLADVDAVLAEEIAERRADPAGTAARDDICSLLVRARFEDGSEMPDAEIRDQMMTLLLAGHETTATRWPGRWTCSRATRRRSRGCRPRSTRGSDAYLRA